MTEQEGATSNHQWERYRQAVAGNDKSERTALAIAAKGGSGQRRDCQGQR